MTSTRLGRRAFLQAAAATTGGVLVSGTLPSFLGTAGGAPPSGTLGPVPDLRDGKVRLHLPSGFRYRSFHDTDTPLPPPGEPQVQPPVVLDDGTRLPGRHDGMGAFPGPDGTVVLVRNHEVNGPVDNAFGPGTPYDAHAGGGTTTIRVTNRGEVLEAFTSLNGTQMNCAGGVMPWGSWITCEETVNGPDVGPDFTGVSNVPLTKPHGFVFEVPARGQSDREPITHAGRFAHEAVAFDPKDGILYLTEDNFAFPSGFFRYLPPGNPLATGRLLDGGRLQMLAVKGRPNLNLAAEQPHRATYDVTWVDIEDPAPTFPYTPGQTAPTTNDEALVYVGDQGRAQGAAYFSRLEGQVYDDNVVYFCSTQGGGAAETGPDSVGGYGNGFGQVWAYHTRAEKLQLIYQSPNRATLDFPDNVTTSKRGTLVLCEDNTQDNYLRGLSRSGHLWDIALNRLTSSSGADRSGDEFAGSTFSPDGHTLYVNIQASRGMSFAIWGPWHRIGV